MIIIAGGGRWVVGEGGGGGGLADDILINEIHSMTVLKKETDVCNEQRESKCTYWWIDRFYKDSIKNNLKRKKTRFRMMYI